MIEVEVYDVFMVFDFYCILMFVVEVEDELRCVVGI